MIPVRIENADKVWSVPSEHDNSERNLKIAKLAVKTEQFDGIAFMISAWEPTPEEIERIKGGAPVYLAVSAPAHPVVALSVGPVPNVTG